MTVFSHSEDVYYQIGVSVIGLPQFVIHRVDWYTNVKEGIYSKPTPKGYKAAQREIQKFSSTRPNRKKDKL